MGGKTDGVNFVFYAMLKELDSVVGDLAVKYQYSWPTSRPKCSVSIFKLGSSLSPSAYFSLCAYRDFQLATQVRAPYQSTRFLTRQR